MGGDQSKWAGMGKKLAVVASFVTDPEDGSCSNLKEFVRNGLRESSSKTYVKELKNTFALFIDR